MARSHTQHFICPYCLAELQEKRQSDYCPLCQESLPIQYIHEYNKHSPFFVQFVGWSRVGKTVFLSALTLMLARLSKIWPGYTYAAATEVSQRKVQEINEYLLRGQMPEITPLEHQDVYIMLSENMQRWGGRTIVARDCAGEIFDNLEISKDQAPFLSNIPTTFMFISLADLSNSNGRSMDMLMNNYINSLMRHGVDFTSKQRNLVVVFTKADLIKNLPANLRNYVFSDPLWDAISKSGAVGVMTDGAMAEYLETMERVSDAIRDWVEKDALSQTFMGLAENKQIDLRFSLISSTGGPVNNNGLLIENLKPRRVLDPYFWALELQSTT